MRDTARVLPVSPTPGRTAGNKRPRRSRRGTRPCSRGGIPRGSRWRGAAPRHGSDGVGGPPHATRGGRMARSRHRRGGGGRPVAPPRGPGGRMGSGGGRTRASCGGKRWCSLVVSRSGTRPAGEPTRAMWPERAPPWGRRTCPGARASPASAAPAHAARAAPAVFCQDRPSARSHHGAV